MPLSRANNSTTLYVASGGAVIGATTLALVSPFSWVLPPGTWNFDFALSVSQVTTASTFGLTGVLTSGSATNIMQAAEFGTGTGLTVSLKTATAFGTAITAGATQTAANTLPVFLKGSFTTTSGVTFQLHAQRSAASTTVLGGSWGRVWLAG